MGHYGSFCCLALLIIHATQCNSLKLKSFKIPLKVKLFWVLELPEFRVIKVGDYQPYLTTILPGSGQYSKTGDCGASLCWKPLHYQSVE